MVVAISFGACDSLYPDIAEETVALTARSKMLAEAEAARNIEEAMSFWAEDAIFQAHGIPQIEGKEAIQESMRVGFSSFKEFEGTTKHIELAASGDLAYEYGVNRFVFQGEEGELLAMGKYLLIWRKIDGIWLISAISITNDAPSPVPL